MTCSEFFGVTVTSNIHAVLTFPIMYNSILKDALLIAQGRNLPLSSSDLLSIKSKSFAALLYMIPDYSVVFLLVVSVLIHLTDQFLLHYF